MRAHQCPISPFANFATRTCRYCNIRPTVCAVLTFQGLILALQYGGFNGFRRLCINCGYVVSLLFHVVLGYLMIHGFDEATGGAVAQEKVEAVAGGEVGGGLDGAAVAEDVGAAGTEHGHGVALADTELLQHVELA